LGKEKLSSYFFIVEIDGIQTDRFIECDGLELMATVFEAEEGGYNTSTHKSIGQNRSPRLILKKYINKNNELIHWFQSNINGIFKRKTISVILMESSYEEIKRWNLYNAFPCRWKCSTLDANDNSPLIEIIEIAYD
jgi:phage tail-like protein